MDVVYVSADKGECIIDGDAVSRHRDRTTGLADRRARSINGAADGDGDGGAAIQHDDAVPAGDAAGPDGAAVVDGAADQISAGGGKANPPAVGLDGAAVGDGGLGRTQINGQRDRTVAVQVDGGLPTQGDDRECDGLNGERIDVAASLFPVGAIMCLLMNLKLACHLMKDEILVNLYMISSTFTIHGKY
jgi:hypothetical protein